MREALTAKGKPAAANLLTVYPDTVHGFHADYRPSYNEAAAKEGWARMLAHFAANGAKPNGG